MTTLCNHCGFDIAIRNPSGYCDHLYYPECCDVCNGKKKPESALQQSINELSASIDKNIELLAKQREEILCLKMALAQIYNTDAIDPDDVHKYTYKDILDLHYKIAGDALKTLNKGTL